MVKKRFADGRTCDKCEQAESMLRRRGLWERIDEVLWADEADAESPGMELSRRHGVERAPFFVVRDAEGKDRVYTSALRLCRDELAAASRSGDASSGEAPAPTGDAEDVEVLSRQLAEMEPPEIVDWALARWGADCPIAFSGAEDVVLVDMAWRTGRPFSVFVLDTGRLHPETYAFIERVREAYGVAIDVMMPDARTLQDFVREKGLFSFYRDGHHECCGIRKVEPLRRAVAGRPAWITGQRRDQSPDTRWSLDPIERDDANAQKGETLLKVNPLAAWSYQRIWSYIRAESVPYNELHERGYASIGCAPCTRPIHPGQHPREGRWWWEEATKRECGLHLDPEAGVATPARADTSGD